MKSNIFFKIWTVYISALAILTNSCGSNNNPEFFKVDTSVHDYGPQKFDTSNANSNEIQKSDDHTVNMYGLNVPEMNLFTADDITRQYHDDPKLADSDYKNKTIIVKGVVKERGKDKSNLPYVLLAGYNNSAGVQCHLMNPQHDSVISPGKEVIIKGECAGLKKNVILNNCKPMVEFNLQETLKKL